MTIKDITTMQEIRRITLICVLLFVALGLNAQNKKGYYDNGNLKYSVFVDKNTFKDTCTWYYSNGNPKIQLYFKFGRPWDLIFLKDTAGNNMYGGSLKNGNGTFYNYGGPLQGMAYNFMEQTDFGGITRISNLKNGVEDGKTVEFYKYPDDTASVYTYKEGRLNGYFYQYNKKANVKVICDCVNGIKGNCSFFSGKGEKLHNPAIKLDTLTKLSYDGDSPCQGKYTIYCLKDEDNYLLLNNMYNNYIDPYVKNEPGQIDLEIYFTKGRLDSISRYEYSVFGLNTIITMNWVDSIRTYSIFYNSGSINSIRTNKFSTRVLNGKKNWYPHGKGKYISYYRSGKTEKIIDLLDDNLDGDYLEYTKEGTLAKKKKFRNNNPID